MRYSEAPTLKRRMDMTMEPSLQTIAAHLAELAENPASLPVAPARALAGEGAWEGLGLLSGSSITDIVRDCTYLVLHTVRSRQLGSFATTGAAKVDGG